MFKVPITDKKEIQGECVGCLYWHSHPEFIGRFTGKINEVNIAVFPNKNRTSEEKPDWIITSNKETGYKQMGELFYNEKDNTFNGSFKQHNIFIKKYCGKIKGKKAPDFMIIEVAK